MQAAEREALGLQGLLPDSALLEKQQRKLQELRKLQQAQGMATSTAAQAGKRQPHTPIIKSAPLTDDANRCHRFCSLSMIPANCLLKPLLAWNLALRSWGTSLQQALVIRQLAEIIVQTQQTTGGWK